MKAHILSRRILGALCIWLVIAAAELTGCNKPSAYFPKNAPFEKVSRDDPTVVRLLDAMRTVDQTSIGFRSIPTPLPRGADLRLEKSIKNSHYDTTLHIAFDGGVNSLHFRKSEGDYKWISEQECYAAPGRWGSYGHPQAESIIITYQLEKVDGLPTNQIVVIYSGQNSRFAGRNLTLAEVSSIRKEWRQSQ